ncbi:MAG: PIG-L family deacetylase [Janthinobacterium lividum]
MSRPGAGTERRAVDPTSDTTSDADGGTPGEDITFTHDARGTAETRWASWPGLRDVPDLDLDGLTHLVVVAAHPDDETLGAGGLIASAELLGAAIDVVVASDGEHSHPHSPTMSPAELAVLRAAEVERAVHSLAPGARVHRLDLGDGALVGGVDALRSAVQELVSAHSLVVAPWRGDAHPDHAAAAHAAGAAADAVGARFLEYPVWMWHWARPGDPRVPWTSAVQLRLSPDVLQRKRSALAEHVTQVAPLSPQPGDEVLLPAGVLEHFTRTCEVFLAGPVAEADSLSRGFFEEFYAQNGVDPWGFEDRWYERRKQALTLAVLPRERFSAAVELGCSNGVFTAALAPRCDQLLALDVAESALERARDRVHEAGYGERVRTVRASLPHEFPAGSFDLVVMSEVGYYCSPADLRNLVSRIAVSLRSDGVVVACHWRHLVQGYPLTGDEVHRVLREEPGWQVLAHHEEEDFLLDVFVPSPAVSVARAGGLTP